MRPISAALTLALSLFAIGCGAIRTSTAIVAADAAIDKARVARAAEFNESLYLFHKAQLYASQSRFRNGFSDYQVAELYGRNGEKFGNEAKLEADRQVQRKQERDARHERLRLLRMQYQPQGGAPATPTAPSATLAPPPEPPPAAPYGAPPVAPGRWR